MALWWPILDAALQEATLEPVDGGLSPQVSQDLALLEGLELEFAKRFP